MSKKEINEKATEYAYEVDVRGNGGEDYCDDIRIAFLAGYKQAQKDLGWISVEERLPETADYVFTCVKMNGIPQCVGFHYYKDGKWWEGYGEDTDVEVEYWMPIPKFKEEQK